MRSLHVVEWVVCVCVLGGGSFIEWSTPRDPSIPVPNTQKPLDSLYYFSTNITSDSPLPSSSKSMPVPSSKLWSLPL